MYEEHIICIKFCKKLNILTRSIIYILRLYKCLDVTIEPIDRVAKH